MQCAMFVPASAVEKEKKQQQQQLNIKVFKIVMSKIIFSH